MTVRYSKEKSLKIKRQYFLPSVKPELVDALIEALDCISLEDMREIFSIGEKFIVFCESPIDDSKIIYFEVCPQRRYIIHEDMNVSSKFIEVIHFQEVKLFLEGLDGPSIEA